MQGRDPVEPQTVHPAKRMFDLRFTKKIMPGGVITMPRNVREALDIDVGDFVELEVVGVARRRERV